MVDDVVMSVMNVVAVAQAAGLKGARNRGS
jgi:hypothetical protein